MGVVCCRLLIRVKDGKSRIDVVSLGLDFGGGNELAVMRTLLYG
jgi:hypothetical protein